MRDDERNEGNFLKAYEDDQFSAVRCQEQIGFGYKTSELGVESENHFKVK